MKKYFFIALLCGFSIQSVADTYIAYVNGAFNSNLTATKKSQDKFMLEMSAERIFNNGQMPGLINKNNFVRINIEGGFRDHEEVIAQQVTSRDSFVRSNSNPSSQNLIPYYIELGNQYKKLKNNSILWPHYTEGARAAIDATITLSNELYNNYITKGHSIIIVAHSQGNLYIEAALGLMLSDPEKYTKTINQVKVIGLGSVAATSFNRKYINISQDGIIYSQGSALTGIAGRENGLFKVLYANYYACHKNCILGIPSSADLTTMTGSTHSAIELYLNPQVVIFSHAPLLTGFPATGLSITKHLSNLIAQSFYELNPNKFNQNINKIALTPNSTTTASNWISRTLNQAFAFLGIRDAVAQPLPSLFAYVNSGYTVRVDGTGFDGNEAVSIDGSTCTASTIQRGSGYFTQSCTGGSAAGDANKIRVYDTQYDLDIEVPTAYQTMQLRGPILAPLAPTLSEPTTGTIRLNWSSVSGATGYEVSRSGVAINTVGTTTSYDDAGRTAGTPYCYRLRTIQGGIMSAYSPEACYTTATIKCSGTWNNTQYSVGATESTTQTCQAGYTGNKSLSHICQASGQWGATTTQDNCTLTPAPTCTGSWSSAKYLVGQTEEVYQNTCPAGTTGQVRSWHTCQASGNSAVWGGLAQSDNCTAYLATPTGVYASSTTGGVQITWDSVSGATSYKIYKNGSLYREVSNTSYVDVSVTNGVTYSYSVAAYSNYNGQNVTSPVSGSYSVVYRDGQTGVSPPTNVSAAQYTEYSRKGIRLTWSGAANADSYFVYRRGYSNPYTSATYLAPVGGGDISFTDWVTPGFSGGVIPGQSYCYYIRSIRGSVNSTESNEACAMAP